MKIRGLLTVSVAMVLLLAGAGCSPKDAMRKLTPPADDKLAREFMDDIQRGQNLQAEMLLAPQLRRGDVESGMQQLASVFQAGEVTNIEEVEAKNSKVLVGGANREVVSLSYQGESSSGWFAGTITILHFNRDLPIVGARFNRIPSSLGVLNRFTLQGKNWVYYWFVALALAIPIFILSTLAVCIRTTIRRKWLWLIFILFGVVTFRLNWTTGQFDWAFFNFQLLGASMLKTGIYGPWIVAISLPIGAVAFHLKRSFQVDENSTATRLFTPTQAALACLLGGPLAGGWLMAGNYVAWHQRRNAWLTLAAALGVTLCFVAISRLLPNHGSGTEMSLAGIIGVKWAATYLQGPAVAAHRAQGGRIRSWWKPVGLGLLFFAAVVSAILLLFVLKPPAK